MDRGSIGHEDGCCAYVNAVLNYILESVIILKDNLLMRLGGIALFLLIGAVLALCWIGPGVAQLANSPWPLVLYIIWSRIYIDQGELCMDIGRGTAVELPPEESDRIWAATTKE